MTNHDLPVFSIAPLQKLMQNDEHVLTLQTLAKIEADLKQRFFNMEDPIEALILSVLSNEPLLFVGPPGTAKSRLIRQFCTYLGIQAGETTDRCGEQAHLASPTAAEKLRYFEYLLTPFTEPSELFGYYNIEKAMRGNELERVTEGMMQTAHVVYLDEVFNASSAILNSVLAVMNERIFHDRGKTCRVAMRCMFGATNTIPYTSELRAVFDRFLLRCQVGNIDAQPAVIGSFLKMSWAETYGRQETAPTVGTPAQPARGIGTFPRLLDDIKNLLDDIRALTARGELGVNENASLYRELAQLVFNLRQYGYSDMSNRRLVKLLNVMLLHTLYRSVNGYTLPAKPPTNYKAPVPFVIGKEQMKLFRFAVDDWDDQVTTLLELQRINER